MSVLAAPSDLIALFYATEDHFWQSISQAVLDFDGVARAYLTGVKNLNPLIIKKRPGNLSHILTESERFFAQENTSWIVAMPEPFLDEAITQILKEERYKFSEESTAMWRAVGATASHQMPYREEIAIRRVDHLLADWMIPLIDAFQSTASVTSQYRKAHQRALDQQKDFQHFSLYESDMPVSSMTISCEQGQIRIDDLGTLPPYQHKGHAARLIQHALEEAKERGLKYCFLEASGQGLGLYEKNGFKILFKNHIFAKSVK